MPYIVSVSGGLFLEKICKIFQCWVKGTVNDIRVSRNAGLPKGPKELTDAFCGCEKVKKTFWLCNLFIF